MLKRPKQLQHKSIGDIDLPLLVPSFSSKGFDTFADHETDENVSESLNALRQFGPNLSDAALVSAYDIHHKLMPDAVSYLTNSQIVFIDSGGYELSDEFDSSEPKSFPHDKLDFSFDDYLSVAEKLADTYSNSPLVLTNYDLNSKNMSFEEQIDESISFFSRFPSFGSDLILKPEGNQSVVEPKKPTALS